MKIISSFRSDLLGITAEAFYRTDETDSDPLTGPDACFTLTKLAGELVTFELKVGRATTRTFSWMLIREAITAAKLPPEFLSVCATLSCPAISRD